MTFNVAKKFAIIALPLFTAFNPSTASADCSNDAMGYGEALSNIEIDREQLTSIQDFNTDAPGVFKQAAKDASAEVIQNVLSQYMGTEFINDGIPAYPAYEDARDAFLCAMTRVLDSHIVYAADKAQYYALEEGLLELMLQTAATEDDIKDRIETLSSHINSDAMIKRNHNYTQVDMFIDRAKGQVNTIAANTQKLEAFVNFSISELDNPDSIINRSNLTRLLGTLALQNNDYIPDYLEVVSQDPDMLNATLGIFINDLNTSEYNNEIRDILSDQAQNAETTTERVLANNMLSRFAAISERLLAAPDNQ